MILIPEENGGRKDELDSPLAKRRGSISPFMVGPGTPPPIQIPGLDLYSHRIERRPEEHEESEAEEEEEELQPPISPVKTTAKR
jgi:hypothetical protein